MNDPPRILVIDDDEMLLVLVRHFLLEEGYDLISTADGPQGVQIYMTQRPDVVLLDLALPSMNGLEVLKRIREYDGKAKIIVVTGYSSSESTEIAFQCGARDLLVKPFERRELIDAVKSALLE